MQCKAKSKRSGEQCRRNASIGREVCAMHGGKSPVGIGSPRLKHGRYSRVLPHGLLNAYNEAQADAQLLSLRDEIALIDARINDLLSRADNGESGALWCQLNEAAEKVKAARGNATLLALALNDLVGFIDARHDDTAVWDEITDLVQQRRVLVLAETRHMVMANQTLTIDQAYALMAALTDVIKRHVHDPETLRAIGNDLVAVYADSSSRALN